jgi:hypothetical protein
LILVAQKPLANIDTEPLYGPHGVVFVNGRVWFSAEGSKQLAAMILQPGKLDWSMGTGQDRTHMIYVTADAKKVYTDKRFVRNGEHSYGYAAHTVSRS